MSNPIGWAQETVNPIVGCNNGCEYCYSRRMAPRVALLAAAASGKPVCQQCRDFVPHYHEERLFKLRSFRNKRVFVGSMCDLWSDGVDPAWRMDIFGEIACSLHMNRGSHFITLTKRPERISLEEIGYACGDYPPNLWLGTSATNRAEYEQRTEALLAAGVAQSRTVLSLEPLLGPVDVVLGLIPAWTLIGPMTGRGAKPVLPEVLLRTGNRFSTCGSAVWYKDSCAKAWGDEAEAFGQQEVPEAMAGTVRR